MKKYMVKNAINIPDNTKKFISIRKLSISLPLYLKYRELNIFSQDIWDKMTILGTTCTINKDFHGITISTMKLLSD